MFSKQLFKKLQHIQTPFYFYDMELLRKTLQQVKEISEHFGYRIHYALKANAGNEILRLVQEYGFGADCVSGNEIRKAVEQKFNTDEIVFAGVGKTDEEIEYALDKNIFCFNCESQQETVVINKIAKEKKKTAHIALRINPNVQAHTHHYITTGLEENKFGINVWELNKLVAELKKLKNLKLTGIHFHIGSQITDLSVFKNLCIRVNEICAWFARHHIPVEHLNMGGGLGTDYHHPDKNPISDFTAYFKIFNTFLEVKPFQQVHFELGRSIVAQCGSLISKVLYVKKGVHTNFVILDAGMTELIRPALYQSYHKIENLSVVHTQGISAKKQRQSFKSNEYDVVGPVCESSDCFGKAVPLPQTKRGDIMAIRTIGAYGEVMAMEYNLRKKAKAIYSDDLRMNF